MSKRIVDDPFEPKQVNEPPNAPGEAGDFLCDEHRRIGYVWNVPIGTWMAFDIDTLEPRWDAWGVIH